MVAMPLNMSVFMETMVSAQVSMPLIIPRQTTGVDKDGPNLPIHQVDL